MKYRLPKEEVDNLITIHKGIKDKRNADKIKCLVSWGKGWDWETIKEVLLVGDHYISDLVNKYKQNGIEEVLKNNFSGHNFKMTKEQEQTFIRFLESTHIPNAKYACKYVKDTFNLEYTHNGMVITLRRLGFRYKKPVIIPGKTPSVEIQESFVEMANEITSNLKENEASFFWDGAGMVHNVKLDYGWIKKGKSQVIKTNTGRAKMNINGAYNPLTNEFIGIEQCGKVAVDQVSNIQLMEKIRNLHPKLTKIYIFLDNAPSNKSKKFTEYVNNLKDVEVVLKYLPAYSPNLNLIERLWKYSKKILLTEYYETFKEFQERVIDFFDKEIKLKQHRDALSNFIGKNFHIIRTG